MNEKKINAKGSWCNNIFFSYVVNNSTRSCLNLGETHMHFSLHEYKMIFLDSNEKIYFLFRKRGSFLKLSNVTIEEA